MEEASISETLTYHSGTPNIDHLRNAYEQTVNELEPYFDLCRDSYDNRRNYWAGKSRDHRKHGADAFPWEGASDMEAHVIDERIQRLVALVISSLNKANVSAFPVEVTDIARSKIVGSFLKWMISSGYIDRFEKEMELGANYLLERGILITHVGWQREDRKFLQKLDITQIAQMSPQIAEAIQDGREEMALVNLLQQTFDGLSEKRAIRALKDLKENGEAELPIVKRTVNAPEVRTLAPDFDFFFPPYVTDPQKAPYCFWRNFYTPQELEQKVITDGWDAKFVEEMIENYRGVDVLDIEKQQEGRRSNLIQDYGYEAEELIELIYGYQRLIDPEDGSEGIYFTVFHKQFSGDGDIPGYEDYPIVVTKFSEDSKRLYDTMTAPDLLRGIQNQVKVERDSRVDRNSLATLPPIIHPVGQAPTDYGPGRYIPYRRKGDLDFGPTPPPPTGSIEIEQTLQAQADRLMGLDESPISQLKLQFLVNKFLKHSADVIKLAYKCFQRFGPDSVFFRVTGSPDPQTFGKGNPDENFDVTISYDVLNTDPETQEKKLAQIQALTALDRNGRINVDNLLTVIANSVDPVLADQILQPVEDSMQQVVKQVTDDLSKIFAGIEMPARPNGGQIAMQVIQQYTSQPDIQQRASQDEAFGARLEKYIGQYTFMMQQQQNAQVGRIGTQPAAMGEIDTQNI
jgi:ribosomal protein S8